MPDVPAQLREYGHRLDAAAAPLDELEPALRLDVQGSRRPPGWVYAAAAAIVVFVVLGGVALWARVAVQPDVESVSPPVTPPVTQVSAINAVTDMAVAADGILYALTGEGIAVWDTDRRVLSGMLPLAGLPGVDDAAGPSVEIDHIEVTGDGTLWAAGVADVFVDGQTTKTVSWIKRFDGTDWSDAVSQRSGRELSSPELDPVTDLAAGPYGWGWSDASADEAGASIWATTGGRLVFFDGHQWWDYATPGWSESVDVGAGGEVWIGTSDGHGAWRFFGGVFPWQTRAATGTLSTHQVAVADTGAVWIATDDGSGIINVDRGAVNVYTTDDGLLANSGSVVTGPGETVAVVHADGVSRLVDGVWVAVVLDLPDANTAQSVIDSNGVLWIPTSSGIVRLEGAQATTLLSPDSGTAPAIG